MMKRKEKYTQEQLKRWMGLAAFVNGHALGRRRNGTLCIYRKTGKAPTRKDIVMTQAQFIKDMQRGWH